MPGSRAQRFLTRAGPRRFRRSRGGLGRAEPPGYNQAVGPGEHSGAWRGHSRDAGALLFLFALIWAPFLWRAAEGLTALSGLLTHDVGFQWIPFKLFTRRALDQGVLPLWASQVFAGFPFAAFSHTGVFYPPGWLLLGDYARSVNYFYPLHLCIAGSGVYALCRRLGLGRAASWFPAAVYVFTGKPFYFIHFLPATCSNTWTPWFLASLVGLIRRGRMMQFAAAGLFLALQVLGGDVESTSYALLFAAPFLALVMVQGKAPASRVMAVAGVLFLGIFISLVQVFPLLELSHVFVRNHGVTFTYFSQRRLPWSLLWGALLPVRGAEALSGLEVDAPYFYLGVVTICLAGFAVIARADRSSRFLGVWFVAVLAWSFGSIGLLDRFQALLPVLGRFGTPEHAYFMGQIFLAVLAGQGLERVKGREDARAGVGVLIMAALLTALGASRFDLLSCPALMMGLVAAGVVLIVLIVRLAPGREAKAAVAVIIMIGLLDVYGLAFSYLPKNDPAIFNYSPALKELSGKIRVSDSRYIMVGDQGHSDAELLYHAGLGLDMDEADGWITVPIKRYAELLALADPRVASFKDGKLDHLGLNADLSDGRFIDARGMPVLDLISLRWIIDRRLPLKFSSPFFLSAEDADFHRRPIGGGAGISGLLHGESAEGYRVEILRPDHKPVPAGTFADAIMAGPGEIYSFRIFISAGDELRFRPVLFRTGPSPGPAPAGEIRLTVKSGDTTETMLVEELAPQGGISLVRPGPAGAENVYRVIVSPEAEERPAREERISLKDYGGKTVELTFSFAAASDETSLLFMLRDPAIVNNAKPIRLRANPEPGLYVYENTEALPRAFVAHRGEVIADGKEMLERLGEESRYGLAQKVFLEPDAAGYLEGLRGVAVPPGAREGASLDSRRPGEEIYLVNSAAPGLLFVSDQYYPGWRAYVRGKETRILRADYDFRAVPVPEGVSAVRMVYEPASFRVGLFASMASLLGVAAGVMIFRRGRKDKD